MTRIIALFTSATVFTTLICGCGNNTEKNAASNNITVQTKANIENNEEDERLKIQDLIIGEWQTTSEDTLFECYRRKVYSVTISNSKVVIDCNIKAYSDDAHNIIAQEKSAKRECDIFNLFVLNKGEKGNVVYKMDMKNFHDYPQFSTDLAGSEIIIHANKKEVLKVELNGMALTKQ